MDTKAFTYRCDEHTLTNGGLATALEAFAAANPKYTVRSSQIVPVGGGAYAIVVIFQTQS